MPDAHTAPAIVIHCDGACSNNQQRENRGGWGAILLSSGRSKEISGAERNTSNNRMELLACIAGLSALPPSIPAVLYSDSSYAVNGIAKGWAKRWQSRGWLRTKTEKAENIDLWERLLALCALRPVEFRWVKGHAGHPDNERCDVLAARAVTRLAVDSGLGPRGPVGVGLEVVVCRQLADMTAVT